jgi:hydroxymethylpyrimidine pyrophosphatase-like HAD family hydrolase
MNEPWLIALDIDGTLVHYDQTMTTAVRSAVRMVADAGHHVVIATGRSLVATMPVARMLGLDAGWTVCSNGSVTVRLDPEIEGGYEVTEALTFDPGPAIRLLHEALPGSKFAVEDLGIGFRLTELFPEGELAGEHRVVSLDELWSDQVTRVVVRGAENTTEEFSGKIAALQLAGVEYAVGYTAWMDLAPLGVNKASTLEKVRTTLGIPPVRTFAIGDGNNDIEMLQWAARGIAMGHAPKALHDVADEITGTIEDDGVATALAKHFG